MEECEWAFPKSWTLKAMVGYVEMCYEFAENRESIKAMGDGIVGKKVRVHVDSFDGSTYFAGIVGVLG